MEQIQVKHAPKFGIIYPQGIDDGTGIKVVKSYTHGSMRIHHPDGTTTHTIPGPVIHELFGGGFCYQDGKKVTNREHLEAIGDPRMREAALSWFDNQGELNPTALNVEHPAEPPQRPEPLYTLSTDMGKEESPLTEELDKASQDKSQEILSAIGSLADLVKGQDERIQKLEGVMAEREAIRKKQSIAIAKRWREGKYDNKVLRSRGRPKKENPDVVPETTKEM